MVRGARQRNNADVAKRFWKINAICPIYKGFSVLGNGHFLNPLPPCSSLHYLSELLLLRMMYT